MLPKREVHSKVGANLFRIILVYNDHIMGASRDYRTGNDVDEFEIQEHTAQAEACRLTTPEIKRQRGTWLVTPSTSRYISFFNE